jgi:hypothetical protein
MTKDVAHSLPKPVSEVGSDFMRGMTVRTAVAAALDQCQFCLRVSQDIIVPGIDRAIEPGWSCMSHEGFRFP